jgi:hypothetical protein
MFVTQIIASKQIGLSGQTINRMLKVGVLKGKQFGHNGTVTLIDLNEVVKYRPQVDEIKTMSRLLCNNPQKRFLTLDQLSQAFSLEKTDIEKRIEKKNITTKKREGVTFFSTLEIYFVIGKKPCFEATHKPVEVHVEINWNEVHKARIHEPQPEHKRTSKKPTTPAEWSRALRSEWKRRFAHA